MIEKAQSIEEIQELEREIKELEERKGKLIK